MAPVLGRGFTEAERASSARVVMLSESLWRTRFGSSPGVLLAGSCLMVRSLVRLLNEDPGFRAGKVLKFDLPLPGTRYSEDAQQVQFFALLLERIRALPGVHCAGGINELRLPAAM